MIKYGFYQNISFVFNFWGMFDWIFGSKKEEKKQEESLGKDEMWIYEYVRQYLSSPLWRNPILDFLEEHCVVFEDKEENKFEYTKIFQ